MTFSNMCFYCSVSINCNHYPGIMADPKIPLYPTQVASWKDFFANNGSQAEHEFLAYYYALYYQRHEKNTSLQQLVCSMAYLLSQDAKYSDLTLRPFFQCVECHTSAVVDGDKHGRILPCGHIMHAACMATYCGIGENSPRCPQCKELFCQMEVTAETMLQYSNLATAVGILSANDKTKEIASLKHAAKVSNFKLKNKGVSELEKAVLDDATPMDTIVNLCKKTIDTLKQEYVQVAKKCIINIQKYYQDTKIELPKKPDTSRKRPAPASASATEYKRPKQEPSNVPDNLQADVLPEGQPLTRPINNFAGRFRIMATKFDGKCNFCKRKMLAGKTLIVSSPGEKFRCTICMMGRTSKEVYDAIIQNNVPDNFVQSPPKTQQQQPQPSHRSLKDVKPPPKPENAEMMDAGTLLGF